MPHAYSEDQLVEQRAIELFWELGWTTVSTAPTSRCMRFAAPGLAAV